LDEAGLEFSSLLLHESLTLNQGLLRLPFKFSDLSLSLSFNIWEFYEGVLAGKEMALVQRPSTYRINRTSQAWISWEGWCEDVVDRVYRRKQFLYPLTVKAVDKPILVMESRQVAVAAD
jgi:hypothetical protein